MPSLKIPNDALPALKLLADLPEESWLKLEAELSKHEQNPAVNDVLASIDSLNLPGFSSVSARQMTQMVLGLRTVVEETGKRPKDVIKSLLTSLIGAGYQAGNTKELDRLASRLTVLLDPKNALATIARMRNLVLDNPCSFVGTRVITDVRPIFGDSVEEKPIAMAIIHTLKIVHVQNYEQREFFVVLDDRDLATFSAAIDRAKQNSLSLRKALSNTAIKLIGDEE